MLGIKQDQKPDSPDEGWIGPAPWLETPLPGPISSHHRAHHLRDHMEHLV